MAGVGREGRDSEVVTVREAHDEDVGACAALAAAERGDDAERARARCQADLGLARRRSFVATADGCFAGFGRTTHFIPPAGAPSNVGPEGDNRASLDLHARLGFVEVTRDFAFPGVSFDGGVGVLCRAARQPRGRGAPCAALAPGPRR